MAGRGAWRKGNVTLTGPLELPDTKIPIRASSGGIK